MSEVFLVNHIYKYSENMDQEEKFIGAFSSFQTAEVAVKDLCDKPGFRLYPNIVSEVPEKVGEGGFFIEAYEVNKIHWQEGFVSIETQ